MKTLNSSGFRVSSADKKAFEHYVLTSMKTWSLSALRGMINKAVKTIMKDYYEKYKATQEEIVSADLAVIIPAILALPDFVPYNREAPEAVQVQRKQPADQEIWAGGFQVEDYEEQALRAYYSDPEVMLQWFMENKVFQRKKAFVKEFEQGLLKDPEVHAIPAKQDDFIDMVTAKPGYKNRAQIEAEL